MQYEYRLTPTHTHFITHTLTHIKTQQRNDSLIEFLNTTSTKMKHWNRSYGWYDYVPCVNQFLLLRFIYTNQRLEWTLNSGVKYFFLALIMYSRVNCFVCLFFCLFAYLGTTQVPKEWKQESLTGKDNMLFCNTDAHFGEFACMHTCTYIHLQILTSEKEEAKINITVKYFLNVCTQFVICLYNCKIYQTPNNNKVITLSASKKLIQWGSMVAHQKSILFAFQNRYLSTPYNDNT